MLLTISNLVYLRENMVRIRGYLGRLFRIMTLIILSRIHPSPDESGDIKIMIGLVNLVKHNQFHRISSTSWRTFSRYATPSSK